MLVDPCMPLDIISAKRYRYTNYVVEFASYVEIISDYVETNNNYVDIVTIMCF